MALLFRENDPSGVYTTRRPHPMLFSMRKLRIFILYRHPLFGRGLESLLKQEKGLEVVGAAWGDSKALHQIRSLRPDVVIVEGEANSGQGPSLWEVLQESPSGRVISVDLEEDQATIYTTSRLAPAEAKDLIKAVKAGLV